MERLSEPGSPTSLCIEYRRMLAVDRAFLLNRVRVLVSDEESGLPIAEQTVLEELNARVVSWTLRDDSEAPMTISISSLRALETTLLASIAVLVLGLEDDLRESDTERERNLVEGVQLLLTNPRVATRDCEDCQQHVYDERTGRRVVHANKPVVRPPGTDPPCRILQVGCPKGSPEQPRSLTLENRHVYRHYRECRATGSFNDDPIVRRHAALIQAVESVSFQQGLVRRLAGTSNSSTSDDQDGE